MYFITTCASAVFGTKGVLLHQGAEIIMWLKVVKMDFPGCLSLVPVTSLCKTGLGESTTVGAMREQC